MNDYILSELQRLLLHMCMVATVNSVDAINYRLRVDLDGIESGWLPWATGAAGAVKVWRAPSVGEQVLVLSPGGDLARAVVLCGIFHITQPANGNNGNVHRINYPDGAEIEYDFNAHACVVNLPAGATLTVTASGGITLNGNVSINGTLTTTGDTVAAGISVANHTHGGIMPGGASTGTPQ